MSAARLTSFERRILRAAERYYGGNDTLGDYETELQDVARDIMQKHSKNKHALGNLAYEQELSDELWEGT